VGVTVLLPTSSGRLETGIGRYCLQVLKAFERAGVHPDVTWLRHHLLAVGDREFGYYIKFALFFARSRMMPARKRTGTVVHTFNAMMVPANADVVTMWDLIPFHVGLRGVLQRPPLYSLVCRMAERNLLEFPRYYIAISEAVQQEMHEYYDVPLDRIKVARPAVDLDLFRRVEDPEVPFARDKVNILHVGTAVPRKNILGIVEALGRLGPERFRLVRVGPPTEPACLQEYTSRAEALGLEILELGYAPDDRLPAYYSAADLVLFPSTAEGAGIPPLEAMACGTNVVVSDLPVHREMCGAAATYCGIDPDSIARSIDRALSHPIPRDTLIAHVRSWTWDDVAAVHLRIYEELGYHA